MATDTRTDELRAMDTKDLAAALKDAKDELFNLRFQSATGQLSNSSRLREVKKDIARIYTIMRENELGITTPIAGGAK